MMQLQPKEYFVIARAISDPLDATTYYVRAEIRNAKTDAVIDTLNLTDKTAGRFTTNWQVPEDSSGLGFYITIITRVYTDDAYTILADSYSQEIQTYLVQERANPNLGGGAGGPDIDYKKITNLFSQAAENIAKSVKPVVSIGKQDLYPLSAGIQRVESAVRELADVISKKPNPKGVNLSPILEAIKKLNSDHEENMRQIASYSSTKSDEALKKILDILLAIKESKNEDDLREKMREILAIVTPVIDEEEDEPKDDMEEVKKPKKRPWLNAKEESKDDIKNKYVIHNSTGLQINLNEIYKLE
jgi:hypothetical protein